MGEKKFLILLGFLLGVWVAAGELPSLEMKNDNCFLENIDFWGDNIGREDDVEDALECQKICAEDENCFYFTFLTESKQCFLKSADAVYGKRSKKGIIAGPKSCTYCFEANIDYEGNDVEKIEGKAVPSTKDCQILCQANEECFYYTYVSGMKRCYLKNSSALQSRKFADGLFSGPKNCDGFSQSQKHKCFEEDMDYSGHDVEKVESGQVESADLCQQMCMGNSLCFFWTFDIENKNCYLKGTTALEGRQARKKTISGPKLCTDLPVGCEERNVDYNGYDVQKIEDGTVATVRECQDLCKANSACKYFTFVTQTGNCYLKDHNALLGRTENQGTVGFISGPKSCLFPLSGFCTEMDIDYFGNDVSKIETGTVENVGACQALCKSHPQCFYYTYASSTKNCYLKNANALERRTATEGYVSGSKDCNTHPPGACFELHVDFKGHDVVKIETGQVTSAAMCQDLCKSNRECFFWTWVRTLNNCFLKSPYALEGRMQDASTRGMVSGPKECINPAVMCYEINVDYVGNDVEKVETGEVSSAGMCQTLCKSHRHCFHWTWVRKTGYCYLKNSESVLGWKRDSSTTGLVSGPKDCKALPPPCYELNVDYVGHDIMKSEGRVHSAKQCQNLCEKTSGCNYFTWQNEGSNCYLKDLYGLINRRQDSTSIGFVSGPKYCTAIPPGCYQLDIDYFGNDIKKFEKGDVSSAKMCQSLCQTTVGCKFFTFVGPNKYCYLKDESALSEKKQDVNTVGFISGPAVCPSHPVCRESSVNYKGFDILRIEDGQIDNANICQTKCQNNAYCYYWTWISETKACYLKNMYALIGRVENEETAGMVSGPRQCTPIPAACHEYNVDYEGYDTRKVETGQIVSANACRSLCQADSSCYYWTWNKNTNSCYLKNQFAPLGRTQNTSTYGLLSGSRNCVAELKGSCLELNVGYHSHDVEKIETGTVTTAAVCQALCKYDPACFFWTWVRNTKNCYLKNAFALLGWTKNESTMGMISAPKDCSPTPAGCHELDVDYNGSDIKKIETGQVSNFEMCQDLCKATEGCHYWTYSSQAKNCHLKDEGALLGRSQDSTTFGLISGPRECFETNPCLEFDANYYGNDIEKIETGKISSAGVCNSLCQSNQQCYYWTFVSDTRNCYLKSKDAPNGRIRDLNTIGMISGAKYCLPKRCFEMNVGFIGFDVDFLTADDAQDCQTACQQDQRCHFFSFVEDSKVCLLKGIFAHLSRSPKVGTISGPKFCPEDSPENISSTSTPSPSATQSSTAYPLPNPSTTQPSTTRPSTHHQSTPQSTPHPSTQRPISRPSIPRDDCFEDGIEYESHNVEVLDSGVVTSAEDCKNICLSFPNCMAFTFFTGDKCFLKDKNATMNRIRNQKAISGPRYCTPRTRMQFCIERGVHFDAENMDVIPDISSVELCKRECQSSIQCAFFTFVPSENTCYLRGKQALYGRTMNQNAISGEKFCKASVGEEQNTDYFGHDILKLETGDIQNARECQLLCQSTDNCFFFSYQEEEKNCYLKSKNALDGRIVQAKVVSGPRTFTPQSSCFEYGFDFNGYDIEKIETGSVATADKCMELCQQDSQCRYWTFVEEEKNCYLKNGNALTGRTQRDGVVSGPRECSFPYICAEPNIDYYGYDVERLETGTFSTAEQCQTECQRNSQCYYYTFDQPLRNCYLKNKYALDGRTDKEGTISGPKYCSNDLVCDEENVDFLGFDVKKIETGEVPDATACRNLCQLEADCSFFTYLADEKNCFLKNSFATNGRVVRIGAISGPRSCNSTCMRFGIDYFGFDLFKFENDEVASARDCEEICMEMPECYYWTYTLDTNGCYLKDANALSGETKRPNTISGDKFCVQDLEANATNADTTTTSTATTSTETTKEEFDGVLWIGVEFTGNNVDVLTTEEITGCQSKCASDQKCFFFTYFPDQSTCYLKGANAMSGKLTNPSAISGDKPTLSTANRGCFETGILYEGDTIEIIRAESLASSSTCQIACQGNPRCFYFTFETDSNTCYLKGPSAATTAKKRPGMVSGPAHCNTTTTTTTTTISGAGDFLYGMDYVGFDIAVATSSSARECQEACTLFEGCSYFTFKINENKCFLKNEDAFRGAATNPISISGVPVAGTPVIKRPATASDSVPQFCFKNNYSFGGSSIEVYEGTVSNALACQSLCKADERCFFFSYNENNTTCQLKGFQAYKFGHQSENIISGPKECMTGESDGDIKWEDYGFWDGVVLSGNAATQYDFKILSIENPLLCQSYCSNTPVCFYFTYNVPQRFCQLKGFQAFSGFETNQEFISGPSMSYGVVGTTTTTTYYQTTSTSTTSSPTVSTPSDAGRSTSTAQSHESTSIITQPPISTQSSTTQQSSTSLASSFVTKLSTTSLSLSTTHPSVDSTSSSSSTTHPGVDSTSSISSTTHPGVVSTSLSSSTTNPGVDSTGSSISTTHPRLDSSSSTFSTTHPDVSESSTSIVHSTSTSTTLPSSVFSSHSSKS